MATEEIEGKLHVLSLSSEETVNLIGLLAALLGETTLQGNMSGAVPIINIVEFGVSKYRVAFLVSK